MAYHTEPTKAWNLESPANGDDIQAELERLYETIAFLKSEVDGEAHLPAPPVGAIIAWHKRHDRRSPLCRAGWKECDGTTLNDLESPMNGEELPNLNGAKESWNSKGTFLRGDSVSGDFENDEFQGHGHKTRKNTHNSYSGGGASTVDIFRIDAWADEFNDSYIRDAVNYGYGTPRYGAETRPGKHVRRLDHTSKIIEYQRKISWHIPKTQCEPGIWIPTPTANTSRKNWIALLKTLTF